MPNSKQRRDAERRRLQRQLQRRQQRQATRRRIALIASIVGTALVIALVVGFIIATGNDGTSPAAGGKGSGAASASKSPSAPATKAAAPGQCTFRASGTAARKVKTPAAKAPTKGTVDVAVKTSQGAMTFTLDRAAAPCAAENFVSLAEQKYFDGTPCHRLTTNGIFVLQCGDPTGTGSGGPGYSFNDELTGKEKYTRGVLAMANSGANTNGSQFFIVYKPSTLGPQYTIFGKVKSGLSVVDKVAARGASTGADGRPKLAISIQTASVAN